jgi:hypothetical protein
MKRTFAIALFVVSSGLSVVGQTPSTAPTPPRKQIVTAAQANGVYRYYKSEFRILALGHNKLKLEFDGIYMTVSGTPNMGTATGEAILDGDVATFKPADTEQCEITLVFLPNKLKVTQSGSDADCGFGHNVYATGTYRKIRSGKPKSK